MSRNERLNRLQDEVKSCKACLLCNNKGKSAFSRGNENAKIMLVGEAPGKQEYIEGKPFVGKSGQQLDVLLSKAGFNPEQDIYFCNVVKCRPVKDDKDRKPNKREVDSCIKYLYSQIEIIQPKVIILCGNTAKNIFKITKSMKTVHGTVIDYNGIKLIPVYHPRASITNEVKLSDFKKVKKLGIQ